MTKLIRVSMMALAFMLVVSPAFADEAAQPSEVAQAAAAGAAAASQPSVSLVAVGAGLVILGAGFGIGRIGGQAVEGMSRQPEAAGSIQTAMIISAALIEGATFFALIVCLIA